MEDKEYRTIKARIAYREMIEQLPKCDSCSKCSKFIGRGGKHIRACILTHRIIEGRILTSPEDCPLREGVF